MNKTKKVMTGISSTALLLGMVGCGTNTGELPPVPDDTNCGDWEWDEDDGVWECDDDRSAYYGHYFFGGHFYKSKSILRKSKDYISYKNSSSFKGISGDSDGTNSSIKKSSGFGSGSKSYGG